MNSWWEDLLEKITVERVIFIIIGGLLLYGIYWLAFESSTTTKLVIAVLVISITYMGYMAQNRKQNNDDDDL